MADEFGLESIVFFEIIQPICSRRYGDAFGSPTGGCTAQLGVTGDRKCFNTRFTCQDPANYDPTTITIRFSRDQVGLLEYGAITGSGLENSTNLIPSLISVSATPSALNLGGMDRSLSALGQRETITVELQDHKHSDLHVDPYRLERPASSGSPGLEGYDPFEVGTFWGKWLARNPYHANYFCRVRQGYRGGDVDPYVEDDYVVTDYVVDIDRISEYINFPISTYVIDRIDGPVNGMVKVVAKDLFSKIEARKAVAPPASRGELLANISAVATSATLSPSGIGDLDYPYMEGSPHEFYVAIGDEIIRCGRLNDTLQLIERGALNTTAEAHEAEDLVQWVLVYVSQFCHDIVYDLLVNHSEIPASLIDAAEWDQEAETLIMLYTARIAEPVPVIDLIGELAEQAGFTIWPDPVTQMIKFKALRAAAATPTVDDDSWIIDGTLSSKIQISKRVSQVWVYYGQISPTEDLEKRSNFRSRLVVIDTDAESSFEYGVPAIRTIFSRWIPQNGRAAAEDIADRILSSFRDPPIEVEFKIPSSRDGALELGQIFGLEVSGIQDVTGEIASTAFAVLQMKREENTIRVKATSLSITPQVETTERIIYIENDDYNLNLRTIHDLLYSAPTGGSPSETVTFIIISGVTIGSVSTSTPALRTGSWPANVHLTVENNGRIQGKGGKGGNGGSNSNGVNGGTGGTAFKIEYITRLDNSNGQIWGGGGGGGGGGGILLTTTTWFGGGGGGGARGIDPGSGGTGGASYPTFDNGNNGSAGTTAAGGSGGAGGTDTVHFGGAGGTGGGAGLAGNTGGSGSGPDIAVAYSPGNGGAAGKYIDGISNVVWQGSPNGDVRGNVS